ncbi:MAG: altronate oxidoreductase, partial [Chitinophagales bacterium]
KTEQTLGYHDELMIMCEIYRLWAVEVKSPRAKKILSFSEADPGMILAPDIQVYRDLKLRILNGSHTLSCGLAHLAGFTIVREAMGNSPFANYVEDLMMEEIVPVIVNKNLTMEMAVDFARKVLERFRNPYLEHKWLSITMQYASKMHMRDLPLLIKYYELYSRVPEHMALGWAAHLLFMKSAKGSDGQYYGEINGRTYLVNDNQAAHYAELWRNPEHVVENFLGDKTLWEKDLNQLTGFTDSVSANLEFIREHGAAEAIKNIQPMKSFN